MERDDQSGAFARRALRARRCSPSETPMRALGSGQHLLRRRKGFGCRELNGVFQAEGLATDHFEPGPPDATAWPVAPEHRSSRKRCSDCVRRRGT